jgi:hypothetical protein
MKKNLLLIFAILFLGTSLVGQNQIQLNINNKLGAEGFALNMAATNNITHDFKITRLQYYISEISVIHDGGTETAIEDLYVLANAADAESTQIDLGSHDINEVEGVNFHIGVDYDHNHLDPSTYQASHPLAPQNPSMHWGWASGYRFLAIEGDAGSSYDQDFELHGLGNDNYFKVELTMAATATDNVVLLNVDADYTHLFEDIQINSGVIVHGVGGEAKKAMENMRDFVFTPAQTTSTVDFSEISGFDVYPNPTHNGSATFMVSSTENYHYEVVITDMLGRQIQHFQYVNSNEAFDLNLTNSGLYNISLRKEGQNIITKRLISK